MNALLADKIVNKSTEIYHVQSERVIKSSIEIEIQNNERAFSASSNTEELSENSIIDIFVLLPNAINLNEINVQCNQITAKFSEQISSIASI